MFNAEEQMAQENAEGYEKAYVDVNRRLGTKNNIEGRQTYKVILGKATVKQLKDNCILCADCEECSLQNLCSGMLCIDELTDKALSEEVELYARPTVNIPITICGGEYYQVKGATLRKFLNEGMPTVYLVPIGEDGYLMDLCREMGLSQLEEGFEAFEKKYIEMVEQDLNIKILRVECLVSARDM